jgi:hypothetical protein
MESNTKQLLFDDSNFDQKVPYSYEKLIWCLEEVNKDLDNLKPYQLLYAIYEFTKVFNTLSTALSVAFSDITTKVDNWRQLFKTYYKDLDTMQQLMEKEIELKLEQLNGDNNSKLGHKKKTTYYEYISGTRTIVRMSWFMNFMFVLLKSLNTSQDSFSKLIKSAYDKVLAPHHPWLVRSSAHVGFSFAPSKRAPVYKAFFGTIYLFIYL